MSPKCQWRHHDRQHLLHQTAAAAPRADSPAPPPPPPFPRDGGRHAVVTAAAAHTQAAVPRWRPHWRRRGTRSAATRQATHAAGRRQRVRRATRGTKRRLPRRAPTRPRPPPSARVMAGATPWSPLWRRRHRRRCHGGSRTGRGGARASLPRRAPHARAVCGLTCNRTFGSGRRLPHRPLTRAAPPPIPSGALDSQPRARLLVNCGWLGGRRPVWLSGCRRDSRPLSRIQCTRHSVASHLGGRAAAATIHFNPPARTVLGTSWPRISEFLAGVQTR